MLGWAGLGWAGLGWAGLGWAGEHCKCVAGKKQRVKKGGTKAPKHSHSKTLAQTR